HRPGARLVLPAAVLAAVVLGALAAGGYLVPATAPQPAAGEPSASPTDAGVPSPVPTDGLSLPPGLDPPPGLGTPNPTVGVRRPADVLVDWAARTAAKVGVPPVAMQAYGYAELALSQTLPGCHLTWTTLAAIGKVESAHGSANNANLLADGRAFPSITGDPLNGQGGRAAIPDTDEGALDNDRTWDRAVGPMQFIPGTWQTQAVDADNDGIRDPNDIDDAALAAGNYLCRGGRDLAQIGDWWAAILTYNDVQPYARAVYDAANDYGVRSRT
ncbi:MAG TPA: lytic transglycosylase domain-containing protein, partial [Pilimelia sp.]|nr:lytic transglycosylase domain-containing protein [Pilimelia sp.]